MPLEPTSSSPASIDTIRRAEEAARAATQPASVPTGTTAAAATDVEPGQRAPVDPARQSAARRTALAADPQVHLRHHELIAATPTSTPGPHLPAGYESLHGLARQLPRLDARFSPETPRGRAALSLALAIGGTEVYGQGTADTDFFTRRGGTGNRMLGFAQMNLAFHRRATSTPERYAKTVADMLTGARPMPNSNPSANHAAALADAVENGQLQSGADLRHFMERRGFGGSNWQGIDDGWARVPGLGDALVRFLNHSGR